MPVVLQFVYSQIYGEGYPLFKTVNVKCRDRKWRVSVGFAIYKGCSDEIVTGWKTSSSHIQKNCWRTRTTREERSVTGVLGKLSARDKCQRDHTSSGSDLSFELVGIEHVSVPCHKIVTIKCGNPILVNCN